MRKVFVIVLLAVVFASAVSHRCLVAEADVATVAPEVVTGSRIYTDLDEIPAPTYVITAEEIAASGATDLGSLLDSRIPGIFIKKKSGVTQESQIWMRGFTNQVLVLHNGIPLYRASGGVDFGTVDFRSFPLEDIERIEVVKGGASAIYGSMAAGGVINIITKKPDKTGGRVLVEAGSNDWRRYYVSGSASGEGLRAGVWYERVAEGRKRLFYETTPDNVFYSLDYKGDAYGLNLGGDRWIFRATGGEYRYQYNSPAWGVGVDLNDEKKEYSRYSFRYDWDKWYLLAGYDTQKYDILQNINNYYEDSAYTVEAGGKSIWVNALVAWGLFYRYENTEFSDGWGAPVTSNNRYNMAPFAELSFTLGGWVTNLGLRYEIWKQESSDYDELIPRISFQRQFANGNMIYVSASRAFAMPAFYELYVDGAWTTGNPNLKPEKGWSYELGLKTPGVSPWQFGIFYSMLDDKIQYKSNPWPTPGTYINVAEFRTYGIEASKTWRLDENWLLALNGTWQNPEEKANPTSAWVRSTAVPEWEIGGSVQYSTGPWTAILTHNWSGNQGNSDSDLFSQVDLAVAWESENDTIRLYCVNIFDSDYVFNSMGWYYYGLERSMKLSWERRF